MTQYMIDYYGEFEGLWGTCSISEDGVRTTKYYNWVLVEILLQKIFYILILDPGIHKNAKFCSTRAQYKASLRSSRSHIQKQHAKELHLRKSSSCDGRRLRVQGLPRPSNVVPFWAWCVFRG